MYVATIFLIFLWWDALTAFRWPTNRQGQLLHQFYNLAGLGVASDGRAVSTLVPAGVGHQFGMGLGTLIMLANVVLLTGFTLGCNSVRHLVGGRLNSFACFTCANGKTQANEQLRTGYRAWRLSTWFNEHHMEWAWLSLFSVGFTDLYIRLCAMGVWNDPRFF